MRREAAAYLSDIIEASEAIDDVLRGIDLDTYKITRPIRSAVEREFIIIGEAVRLLGQVDPGLFHQVSNARMIIGFRNILTHDYAAIDDETVFGFATADVAQLKRECVALLGER